MAVVRSLLVSLAKGETSELEMPGNVVCLSDDDRVSDEPCEDEATRNGPGDAPAKFSFGVQSVDSEWTVGDRTLGQLMTEARERRGLSREQVAADTHIPAYYVRMIESDSYDAIPDQLYLLPFFRGCATYLGLDATQVVARFIRDFERAESGAIETSVPRKTFLKAFLAKNLPRMRQAAMLVLISAVVLPCLAWGIETLSAALHSRPHSSSSAASPPSQLAAVQPAEVPSIAPTLHAVTTASAVSQIDQPPAPAKHLRRHVHARRPSRIARRSTHATRRM